VRNLQEDTRYYFTVVLKNKEEKIITALPTQSFLTQKKQEEVSYDDNQKTKIIFDTDMSWDWDDV
jgi:hypothetical protein